MGTEILALGSNMTDMNPYEYKHTLDDLHNKQINKRLAKYLLFALMASQFAPATEIDYNLFSANKKFIVLPVFIFNIVVTASIFQPIVKIFDGIDVYYYTINLLYMISLIVSLILVFVAWRKLRNRQMITQSMCILFVISNAVNIITLYFRGGGLYFGVLLQSIILNIMSATVFIQQRENVK